MVRWSVFRFPLLLSLLVTAACASDPDGDTTADAASDTGSGDAAGSTDGGSDAEADSSGISDTDGSGSPDGSGDVALALRVTPNPVAVPLGSPVALEISVIGPDGTAHPAEAAELAYPEGLFDADGVAIRSGRGTLTVAAEGRSVEVSVVTGADLFALGGNTDRIHEVADGSGDLEAGIETGHLPTRARRLGDQLFVVSSGDVFGDTAPTSLRRLDLSTGSWTAAPLSLNGNGGYDIVERDGSTAWLIGHANTVSIIDRTSLEVSFSADLAAAYPSRSIALESGGTAIVDEGLLLVADPGLRADFSYDPGALLLLDNALGVPVDATPDTPDLDVLLLDDGCRNPIWLDRFANEILVGCAGDYADHGAGIAFVDRFALTPTGFVALGAAASSFALDAATGTVLAGDAYGANVWAMKAATREVVRGGEAPAWLAPVRTADFDFTQVFVDSRSRAWAGTYGSGERFLLPLPAPLEGAVAPTSTLLRDGLSIGVSGFADSGWGHAPVWAEARHLVAIAYDPIREARDLTDRLTGPPAGGTALVPNADTATLGSLSEGGELYIDLRGLVLHDGPGPDLVVYENPMMTVTDRAARAIDPARVEVSADGVTFVPLEGGPDPAAIPSGFPTDARVYGRNIIGRSPVFANAANGMAPGSAPAGGDLLDLSGTGLTEVRFLRIFDYAGDNRAADIDAFAWIHWSEE